LLTLILGCFYPKVSVQMGLRTQLSSSMELMQPIFAGGCSPFTNCWLPQLGLHLFLNMVQRA